MRYMLRGFRDTLRKKVFEFLEEENGNLFCLCIRLLKDWIKTGSERITFQDPQKPSGRPKRNRTEPDVWDPWFSDERRTL